MGYLMVLLVGLLAVSCSPRPQFRGTDLDPPISPGQFQLQDQWGQVRSLADLRGRVTILTFMYTHCPDVCPVHAALLQRASVNLGEEARDLAIVVVSVDPKGDTQEAALHFSQAHQMVDRWWYLVGTWQELEPVWGHYYVANEAQSAQDDGLHDHSDEEGGGQQGSVFHSAPVYVLDRMGRARVVITGFFFEPEDLVHDIRLLLQERG